MINYKRELHRREMMYKEIQEQCEKYERECKYLGSHIGTPEEIAEILSKVKERSYSYT